MPSYAGSFAKGFADAFIAAQNLQMHKQYYAMRAQMYAFDMKMKGYDPATNTWKSLDGKSYPSYIDAMRGTMDYQEAHHKSMYQPYGGGGGGVASSADNAAVKDEIIRKSQELGKDPKEALAMWQQESGSGTNMEGDKGSSFGDFQFHFGDVNPEMPHAGMGEDFTKDTGLDPRNYDLKTRLAAVDYALDRMANKGFGDWATSRDKLGLGNKWSDAPATATVKATPGVTKPTETTKTGKPVPNTPVKTSQADLPSTAAQQAEATTPSPGGSFQIPPAPMISDSASGRASDVYSAYDAHPPSVPSKDILAQPGYAGSTGAMPSQAQAQAASGGAAPAQPAQGNAPLPPERPRDQQVAQQPAAPGQGHYGPTTGIARDATYVDPSNPNSSKLPDPTWLSHNTPTALQQAITNLTQGVTGASSGGPMGSLGFAAGGAVPNAAQHFAGIAAMPVTTPEATPTAAIPASSTAGTDITASAKLGGGSTSNPVSGNNSLYNAGTPGFSNFRSSNTFDHSFLAGAPGVSKAQSAANQQTRINQIEGIGPGAFTPAPAAGSSGSTSAIPAYAGSTMGTAATTTPTSGSSYTLGQPYKFAKSTPLDQYPVWTGRGYSSYGQSGGAGGSGGLGGGGGGYAEGGEVVPGPNVTSDQSVADLEGQTQQGAAMMGTAAGKEGSSVADAQDKQIMQHMPGAYQNPLQKAISNSPIGKAFSGLQANVNLGRAKFASLFNITGFQMGGEVEKPTKLDAMTGGEGFAQGQQMRGLWNTPFYAAGGSVDDQDQQQAMPSIAPPVVTSDQSVANLTSAVQGMGGGGEDYSKSNEGGDDIQQEEYQASLDDADLNRMKSEGPAGGEIPLGMPQISDNYGNPSRGVTDAVTGGSKALIQGHSLQTAAAMPNQTEASNQAGFHDSGSAMHLDDIKKIFASVDPGKQLDPGTRNLAALECVDKYGKLTNHQDDAAKACGSMLLTMRDEGKQYGVEAVNALNKGDIKGAVGKIVNGYNLIPDGLHVNASVNDDGSVHVVQSDLHNKPVQEGDATVEQLFQAAHGLGTGIGFWSMLGKNMAKYDPDAKGGQVDPQQAEYAKAEQTMRKRAEEIDAKYLDPNGNPIIGTPGHQQVAIRPEPYAKTGIAQIDDMRHQQFIEDMSTWQQLKGEALFKSREEFRGEHDDYMTNFRQQQQQRSLDATQSRADQAAGEREQLQSEREAASSKAADVRSQKEIAAADTREARSERMQGVKEKATQRAITQREEAAGQRDRDKEVDAKMTDAKDDITKTIGQIPKIQPGEQRTVNTAIRNGTRLTPGVDPRDVADFVRGFNTLMPDGKFEIGLGPKSEWKTTANGAHDVPWMRNDGSQGRVTLTDEDLQNLQQMRETRKAKPPAPQRAVPQAIPSRPVTIPTPQGLPRDITPPLPDMMPPQ